MKQKTESVMIDNRGQVVPVRYVSAYDKLRDRKVRGIVGRARKLRTNLENFVAQSLADLDQVTQLKDSLGERGNVQITSFDGNLRVSIRQRYEIRLDERVRRAREMMLAYIDNLFSRVHGDEAKQLRVIVDEAFRADKDMNLSSARVSQLLRVNIANPDWVSAQQMLRDAMMPVAGKRYFEVATRPSVQHDFRAIRLDIADCWPLPPAPAESVKEG